MTYIRTNKFFAAVWIIFLSFVVIFSVIGAAKAEDALIIHQNYGNTHSKHKNRLENAGHTVTMNNAGSSSYSYTASNYEQVYDIRYGYNFSTADKDRFKTVLSNGGTIYLVGENGNFDARNDSIVTFLREVTGDNNIVLRLNQEDGYVINVIQGDTEIIDYQLGDGDNYITIKQNQ